MSGRDELELITISTFQSYGVHIEELFKSLSETYPSTIRLNVQLHFAGQATSGASAVELGIWLDLVVKELLAVESFENSCDVFVALTDATHLFQSSSSMRVGLGEEEDFVDNAAATIMQLKGSLVQVGMTGEV